MVKGDCWEQQEILLKPSVKQLQTAGLGLTSYQAMVPKN